MVRADYESYKFTYFKYKVSDFLGGECVAKDKPSDADNMKIQLFFDVWASFIARQLAHARAIIDVNDGRDFDEVVLIFDVDEFEFQL